MRSPSLRQLLLVASVLFAMLAVGGIALTSYVIVTNGMQAAAEDAASRVSTTAASVLQEEIRDSEESATAHGLMGSDAAASARTTTIGRLPVLLTEARLGQVDYMLIGDNGNVLWSSGATRSDPAQSQARKLAAETGRPTQSAGQPGNLLSGFVSHARLGFTVVHVPTSLPGGERVILDVTYHPVAEERAIDAIRFPMTALAITAIAVMVLLMQTSLRWVLGLVDNLRRAADSIDAGRLDERLPEAGTNEVGELANSINNLIERLQRRAEAQARFVADASHELATPVAGIRGYTSILREWGSDDPVVRDEAVDAIDRESRRMARLTGDLLNLLHADQGLVLKSERFDPNAMIRDRIAVTASRWLEKDIEYVGPDEVAFTMVGDPDRFEDVISILLENAAKYTEPGGRVTVSTARKRDTVRIRVTDTGRGISENDLPHIFDRFYRSEASRAAGEGGFGLGLAIAKTIITSMGGEISVQSELGKGTTFTLVLPRGRD